MSNRWVEQFLFFVAVPHILTKIQNSCYCISYYSWRPY